MLCKLCTFRRHLTSTLEPFLYILQLQEILEFISGNLLFEQGTFIMYSNFMHTLLTKGCSLTAKLAGACPT